MIGNIVLPIFFLYFVLISGYCSAILNCGLQRFMRDSIYFKHFLILLSIYIFTFILNWYTFDSLSISQLENFEDSKQMKLSYESLKKLGLWFLYSIAIYLLFLLSTKSEVTYILIFFAFTVLAIIVQIILKSISSSSYGNLANKMIITSKDYNGKNKNSIIIAHNCLTIGFFIALLLLCVGFYKYFNRQWIDHAHHWSTEKFLFGTSKCSDD